MMKAKCDWFISRVPFRELLCNYWIIGGEKKEAYMRNALVEMINGVSRGSSDFFMKAVNTVITITQVSQLFAETLRLERTSGDLSINPILQAGLSLKTHQIAWGLVQSSFEHPQWWRSHSLVRLLCWCLASLLPHWSWQSEMTLVLWKQKLMWLHEVPRVPAPLQWCFYFKSHVWNSSAAWHTA